MALKRSTVWLGGYDLTGRASQARLAYRRTELNRTSTSDAHERIVAGPKSARLEASGFLETGMAMPDDAVNQDDELLVSVVPEGVGAIGDKCRTLGCRVVNFALPARAGQLRQWDLSGAGVDSGDLPGDQLVLEGQVVDFRDMVNAATDATSTAVSGFPAVEAGGTLWAVVHLFDMTAQALSVRLQSRSGPLAVYVDRLTWPIFNTGAAPRTSVRTASGPITDTIVRVVVTVTGQGRACFGVVAGVI